MSLMAPFCAALDEIWNSIESVSEGFHTFFCLGKRIITSIISIKDKAHTPAVSLCTTGACDIVKYNRSNSITQTRARTCVYFLTSQHCR